MQLVDIPVALPGCCKYCGTSNPDRGPFLDTGTSEEYYGAVYICKEDALNIARLFGCIDPEQSFQMKLDYDVMERKIYDLSVKLGGMEQALNGMVAAGYSGNRVPPVSDPVNLPSFQIDEGPSSSESELGNGTGEDSQPSNDQGMDELRSNESSVESGFKLSL